MEQVKAEPVAWMYSYPGAAPNIQTRRINYVSTWTETPLYATPQPAAVDGLVRALRLIATNDEYSVDREGNPMPQRPQWSREQCSSIARQAIAQIERTEDGNG